MCSSIDAVHKQFNKYCFRYLSNVSRDKINFVYIVIQFDPYKYYSPSEGLNYLNKYFQSSDNFANKFKKICDQYNVFNNINL